MQELSKVMDGATYNALKEMRRIIKFVLDSKTLGLMIKPQFDGKDWKLQVFSDSDFAGDVVTRISVTGFVLFLMGVAISWKLKAQRSVTLSSLEVEYVALSTH